MTARERGAGRDEEIDALIGEIVREARRRKALAPGSLVLAVDGHEFYRSQNRCWRRDLLRPLLQDLLPLHG